VLLRNDGNGKFSDVSLEAGIHFEGYGLGLLVSDVNQDGWPDIYVANDFLTNDVLYINQRDGTFKNEIKHRLDHQSFNSMGADAGDINA
ncbi:FG-GAP repeat domain-containing protein, partial [Staphylococcus aureus]|uniref:FG-GAP repeat domain-containing protein n=1 Tax=Staphylococcus aureus TaxID=1280 RepID=UPI0021B12339